MTQEEFDNLKIGDYIIFNYSYGTGNCVSGYSTQYRQCPCKIIKKAENGDFLCSPKFNYMYNYFTLTSSNYHRVEIFKPTMPKVCLQNGDLVVFANRETGIYINDEFIVTSSGYPGKKILSEEYNEYLNYDSSHSGAGKGFDIIRICNPIKGKTFNGDTYDTFDCKWMRVIVPLTIKEIERRLNLPEASLVII